MTWRKIHHGDKMAIATWYPLNFVDHGRQIHSPFKFCFTFCLESSLIPHLSMAPRPFFFGGLNLQKSMMKRRCTLLKINILSSQKMPVGRRSFPVEKVPFLVKNLFTLGAAHVANSSPLPFFDSTTFVRKTSATLSWSLRVWENQRREKKLHSSNLT